jgi:hypothetical protein
LGATWEQNSSFSCVRRFAKLQKSKTGHGLELGRFTLRTRSSGVRISPGALARKYLVSQTIPRRFSQQNQQLALGGGCNAIYPLDLEFWGRVRSPPNLPNSCKAKNKGEVFLKTAGTGFR